LQGIAIGGALSTQGFILLLAFILHFRCAEEQGIFELAGVIEAKSD